MNQQEALRIIVKSESVHSNRRPSSLAVPFLSLVLWRFFFGAAFFPGARKEREVEQLQLLAVRTLGG